MENQSLTSRAMLVNLSISQWSARKYDRKVTKEVADNHNTTMQAGRYNKNLLPADSATYKAVVQAANNARTMHYTETLPWDDNGSRLLPAKNFMSYSEKLRKAKDDYEQAVLAFVADYPTLKANAQATLNGLYNETDYPDPYKLPRHFSFDTKVLPLPDPSDFRVSLGDEQVTAIKEQIEQTTQQAVSQAMSDLYHRLHDAVSHIVERLSDDKAIFRDSLIGNVRDLCDLLPRLNLTGDANLDSLKVEIESKLACWEPDDLRDDKDLRAKVARDAEKIQSDLAAFMG